MKKNLLTLGLGTALAQVIPLLFYPVLSRLYSPAEFGLLATINSVVSIIAVLATAKYEKAILIAKDKKESQSLLILSIGLGFCICILSFFIFWIFNGHFARWLNEPKLANWILISPWVAFMLIIYNCYNEWCVKNALFVGLAINKNINSLSIVLSKFFFGLGSLNGGVIYGEVLGRSLSAFSCFAFMRKREKLISIQILDLKMIAKKYIEFPKFTLPDQVLNTVGTALPVFFLSRYFGSAELGYFAMMNSILAIPSVFIGQAVMDVFRKRASVDYEETGNCRAIYKKTFMYMSLIAFSGLLLIIWFLPGLFAFVLGQEWYEAGIYAQIMTPAIAIGFVNNSISSLWYIAYKMKKGLYWQVFYLFMVTGALLLGCSAFDQIERALILLSFAISISYIVNIYCTWRFANGKIGKK